MNQWTRISLLSAMLFTATLTFTAAPAAAITCSPTNPDLNECTNGIYGTVTGAADDTPCLYGNPCPVPCWKDGNFCPPCDGPPTANCLIEIVCDGTLNDCLDDVPCLVGYGCICPTANACVPDVPCTAGEPCPVDCSPITDCTGPLPCASTACIIEACGTACAEPTNRTVCFTYNPDANTNGCVSIVSENKTVNVPTVVTSPHVECIIGNVCVTAPVPGVGPSDPRVVAVPALDGYVEATRVCRELNRDANDCRVPL